MQKHIHLNIYIQSITSTRRILETKNFVLFIFSNKNVISKLQTSKSKSQKKGGRSSFLLLTWLMVLTELETTLTKSPSLSPFDVLFSK